MCKYSSDEIDKTVEEREIMPLAKLRELLHNGWLLFEIADTDDKDIKLLILARPNQDE